MNHSRGKTPRLDYAGQRIWIIGASSGIGRELALTLAARGARLVISARRLDVITELANELGPEHLALACDVSVHASIQSASLAAVAHLGRIDRVIFMAAVYTPMSLGRLDIAATRQMIEVNLLGAFHAVSICVPLLKSAPTSAHASAPSSAAAQSKPQLALCASVAGYTGLPGGQPYSATKAAMINLAESLRAEQGEHIDVRLINPGFVRTPLTDQNAFDMPMIISAESAAQAIAAGLLGRRFEIHFPKRFTLWLKLLRLLPYGLAFKLTNKLL